MNKKQESSDNVIESLKKLEEALEAGKYDSVEDEKLLKSSAIQVMDISKEIEPLLSDNARLALSKPLVHHLTHIELGKVAGVARYFAIRTEKRSVGALKLARALNEIADKYKTTGVLAKPFQIELYNDPTNVGSYASAVFLHLVPEDAKKADNDIYSIEPGGVGELTTHTLADEEAAKFYNLDGLDGKS